MVTVYRDVPTTQTIEEQYTVMVPETRTRTVADTIYRPVYGDIELRTTSMVSAVEPRQGTYSVTRLVPVQEERTTCDCGPRCTTCGWTAPVATDPNAPPPPPDAASSGGTCSSGCCNSCCAPQKTCVTCWKPVCQQVTVPYAVTEFTPEARLSTVSFCEYKPETQLREESYEVLVPETRTRARNITVMRTVAEERPEQYTVMVPYEQRIQVPVPTCPCCP
jgi:hypothetical protein